jgi:hypothetical protein
MTLTKKCFKCTIRMPLFMFPNNNRQYKVASELGKCYVCRICNCKEIINKDSYIEIDKNTNKFTIIKVDNKLKHVFKRFFKK